MTHYGSRISEYRACRACTLCLGTEAAGGGTGAAADEYNLNVVDCNASVTVARRSSMSVSGVWGPQPEANVKWFSVASPWNFFGFFCPKKNTESVRRVRQKGDGEAPPRSDHVPQAAGHRHRSPVRKVRRQVCHLRLVRAVRAPPIPPRPRQTRAHLGSRRALGAGLPRAPRSRGADVCARGGRGGARPSPLACWPRSRACVVRRGERARVWD